MAAILLYLGADFVQQANASKLRQEELDHLEQQIAAARQETEVLQESFQYVRSPEAAEAWAREAGWAQPDEVSVVLVAPPADARFDVEGQEETAAAPDTYRIGWWDLFFGER
jgi:ribosomal protein L16 Arg81 hydroxylase